MYFEEATHPDVAVESATVAGSTHENALRSDGTRND
jgi:hypothetical protein